MSRTPGKNSDVGGLRKRVRWTCSGLVFALGLRTCTFKHHQSAIGDGQSPDSTEDEEACGAALTQPRIILFILTTNNIIVKVHLRFW